MAPFTPEDDFDTAVDDMPAGELQHRRTLLASTPILTIPAELSEPPAMALSVDLIVALLCAPASRPI